MTETHFISFDTIKSGRKRRAACGRYVDLHAHSQAPTCADCAAVKAGADAADAAIEARADAAGVSVEELLFGADDDEPRAADCPQVPR
jgi:hypothetical protein